MYMFVFFFSSLLCIFLASVTYSGTSKVMFAISSHCCNFFYVKRFTLFELHFVSHSEKKNSKQFLYFRFPRGWTMRTVIIVKTRTVTVSEYTHTQTSNSFTFRDTNATVAVVANTVLLTVELIIYQIFAFRLHSCQRKHFLLHR